MPGQSSGSQVPWPEELTQVSVFGLLPGSLPVSLLSSIMVKGSSLCVCLFVKSLSGNVCLSVYVLLPLMVKNLSLIHIKTIFYISLQHKTTEAYE